MPAIPDYTEIYEGDRYCLMCRQACPVERVTRREATSPHGWALLVASVKRGLLDWDADTVDTLYQCADCGLCQANCVSTRPLPSAIVAARAGVVARGSAPVSVHTVNESLQKWGHPYGEAFHNPLSSSAGRHAEVGLFVGAATTAERPQAVQAAVKLLDAAEIEHTLISTDRSGVYLPFTLGLWDTAVALAKETVEEIGFRGVKKVITLSREDTHTFQHIYKEIGVDLPEELQVLEMIEWLAGALAADSIHPGRLDLEGYVYHDPAHTPRIAGGSDTARRVLAQVAGAHVGEMLWRERVAAPAGTVGGFRWTQPALAEKLTRARIEEAKSAGAAGIVTEDPQCTGQLAKYAEGLPVVNLVELLAEKV